MCWGCREEASSRDQAHPVELSPAGWGIGGIKKRVCWQAKQFFLRGKKRRVREGAILFEVLQAGWRMVG